MSFTGQIGVQSKHDEMILVAQPCVVVFYHKAYNVPSNNMIIIHFSSILRCARKTKKGTLKRPKPKRPTVTHFLRGMSGLVGSRRGVKEFLFGIALGPRSCPEQLQTLKKLRSNFGGLGLVYFDTCWLDKLKNVPSCIQLTLHER